MICYYLNLGLLSGFVSSVFPTEIFYEFPVQPMLSYIHLHTYRNIMKRLAIYWDQNEHMKEMELLYSICVSRTRCITQEDVIKLYRIQGQREKLCDVQAILSATFPRWIDFICSNKDSIYSSMESLASHCSSDVPQLICKGPFYCGYFQSPCIFPPVLIYMHSASVPLYTKYFLCTYLMHEPEKFLLILITSLSLSLSLYRAL